LRFRVGDNTAIDNKQSDYSVTWFATVWFYPSVAEVIGQDVEVLNSEGH